MENVSEPWLLEPRTIRTLKTMRTEIRNETGQAAHFSNKEGIVEMVGLGLESSNPEVRAMAVDLEFMLKNNS